MLQIMRLFSKMLATFSRLQQPIYNVSKTQPRNTVLRPWWTLLLPQLGPPKDLQKELPNSVFKINLPYPFHSKTNLTLIQGHP
jgi:hypothetical protein